MVQFLSAKKGANVQIGDLVNKAGIYTKPGVVTEKKDDGIVVIDTDPELIKKYHRYSNVSGLTAEEKDKFNGIMDEVMGNENNADRINMLQDKIDTLRADPGSVKVVSTLRNEQAQLIRHARELPRVYAVEQDKLR